MVEKIAEIERPSGFRRWLFRLPLGLYRVGLGWLLGSRFLLLEHVGRVSGETRQVVLEIVQFDKESGTCFVVAAWGDKADWYQNIQADPSVGYQVGRRRFEGFAERLPKVEAEELFLQYGRRYPFMLQGLMRFVGYRVHRSDESYRALAEHLPVVRISPEQRRGE